ncbi:MAG: hypothetical protein ACE5NW_06395 [Acidiferrobacterales bacterium]
MVRFWNHEVLQQTENVLQDIFDNLIATPARTLPHLGEG